MHAANSFPSKVSLFVFLFYQTNFEGVNKEKVTVFIKSANTNHIYNQYTKTPEGILFRARREKNNQVRE